LENVCHRAAGILMNLSPFVDVRFGDKEAFEQFIFMHLITHNNIAEYLADQNLKIDNYPLDNLDQQKDWLLTHQLVHNAIAGRLSLAAPPDLELYDLLKREEFDDWQSLHGQEHDRVFLAIGV
jgi:hypothetical protein